MTDTNSKAQVTEEAIRKAGKVVIDHMADNGLTYEAVAQELTDCLMRIVDPDFIAALAAQEKPEPGVAVKWLDWVNTGISWQANSPVGIYVVSLATNRVYLNGEMVQREPWTYETPEQAKAAAQADYEQRIRSALVSTQAQATAIPDGWKLVPTRLTANMMAAASKGLDDTASMNAAYELALAVAPSPDLPEGE